MPHCPMPAATKRDLICVSCRTRYLVRKQPWTVCTTCTGDDLGAIRVVPWNLGLTLSDWERRVCPHIGSLAEAGGVPVPDEHTRCLRWESTRHVLILDINLHMATHQQHGASPAASASASAQAVLSGLRRARADGNEDVDGDDDGAHMTTTEVDSSSGADDDDRRPPRRPRRRSGCGAGRRKKKKSRSATKEEEEVPSQSALSTLARTAETFAAPPPRPPPPAAPTTTHHDGDGGGGGDDAGVVANLTSVITAMNARVNRLLAENARLREEALAAAAAAAAAVPAQGSPRYSVIFRNEGVVADLQAQLHAAERNEVKLRDEVQTLKDTVCSLQSAASAADAVRIAQQSRDAEVGAKAERLREEVRRARQDRDTGFAARDKALKDLEVYKEWNARLEADLRAARLPKATAEEDARNLSSQLFILQKRLSAAETARTASDRKAATETSRRVSCQKQLDDALLKLHRTEQELQRLQQAPAPAPEPEPVDEAQVLEALGFINLTIDDEAGSLAPLPTCDCFPSKANFIAEVRVLLAKLKDMQAKLDASAAAADLARAAAGSSAAAAPPPPSSAGPCAPTSCATMKSVCARVGW